MMAFVDTNELCPQRGIVDTQDQELQMRCLGGSSGAAPFKSVERSWKRRLWRVRRYREWRVGTM